MNTTENSSSSSSSSSSSTSSVGDLPKHGLLNGFKEFLSRGNMIDMAVGIVMGTAVTAIVHSIVNNLLNPLIALLFHSSSLENALKINIHGTVFSFGAVLSSFINFLAIGFAIYFFVIVPLNKIQKLSSKVIKSYKPSAFNKFIHSHHFKHKHDATSSSSESTVQKSAVSLSSESTASMFSKTSTSSKPSQSPSTLESTTSESAPMSNTSYTSQADLSSSLDVDKLTTLQQETLNVLIQIKAELMRVQQKTTSQSLDSSSTPSEKATSGS